MTATGLEPRPPHVFKFSRQASFRRVVTGIVQTIYITSSNFLNYVTAAQLGKASWQSANGFDRAFIESKELDTPTQKHNVRWHV